MADEQKPADPNLTPSALTSYLAVQKPQHAAASPAFLQYLKEAATDPVGAAKKVKTWAKEWTEGDFQLIEAAYPKHKKYWAKLRAFRASLLHQQSQSTKGFSTPDPLLFFDKVLGWKPSDAARFHGYQHGITPDQVKIAEAVTRYKRVAVPSGHGTGKTFLIGGGIALWLLYAKQDTIVVTTSAKWEQVRTQVWAELRTAHQRAKITLPGKLLQTELRIGDKWFAIGLSTDEVTKIQGYHSKRVIVLVDEATGIEEEMWAGFEAITLGPQDRIIAFGNPTNPASYFKRVCESPLWHTIRLDCLNHPNVVHGNPDIVSGAVTLEWIKDRLEEYGSEESPLYQSRVRGLWPTQAQDGLISLAWVDEAQDWKQRRSKVPKAPDALAQQGWVALGLDIAGPGSDLCVLWGIFPQEGKFGVGRILWWTVHRDTMETVGKVISSIRELEGRARILCLDDTGIGNAVGSRLVEVQRHAKQGIAVYGPKGPDPLVQCSILRINFGSNPQVENRYLRYKDQLWWQLREALQREDLGLPDEQELTNLRLPKGVNLVSQLTSPFYETTSNGLLRVYDRRDPNSESKKLRMLPTRSPDLAHSLMLAVHGWRAIRPDEVKDMPRTLQELRRQQWKRALEEDLRTEPGQPGPEIYRYM